MISSFHKYSIFRSINSCENEFSTIRIRDQIIINGYIDDRWLTPVMLVKYATDIKKNSNDKFVRKMK